MAETAFMHDPAQTELDPNTLALDQIDVANPFLFQKNVQDSWFQRLRDDDPVHYCADSMFGPYWSVTRYDDIMAVDTNHDVFSSEPAITIRDQEEDFQLPMFIAMDRPKHDQQRSVVNPAVGADKLRHFEPIIRERTIDVLENLPVGETFDWVENVSIELTTRMLATLFDFPFEERRRLTRWSDVATSVPGMGVVETVEQAHQELIECLQFFTELWNERVNALPANDLISMLAHGEATRDMEPMEYLGNLILLIVGGNDTTRNTMSGSVLALHQNPDQFAKLKAEPGRISDMISETIRWQTPLMHMRRTAKTDFELSGKKISAGDKVVMWYLSGNRDERFFEKPYDYLIDRANVRKHLAFGFGIHRCMGNRLAEMQLKILWEEILERFDRVEVMAEPERNPSVFVRGYTSLPVKLHPLAS
ncbi:MAG: cytochrome P450 [Alcanivorax sp.]|jgi:cytochrome P450